MREFFVESLVPFVVVCAVIAGLTAAIFDVRAEPPPPSVPATPPVELTPAAIPDSTSTPVPADPKRQQINDVLTRAVRTLAGEGPARAVPATGESPFASAAVPVNPKLFGAVSKLTEAMRVARDARDERDLARAEELMRSARQEMDAACSATAGGGPLCESAAQIRQLGY